MLLTLRIIHILAAGVLVGSVIFNYFLLRPALRLIPPAHAVVVAQRVGNLFTYTGWTTLGLLFLSGLLRLGDPSIILKLDFYTSGYGRSLGMMIIFWFLTVVSSTIMTFTLRPKLMKKLSVSSNPTLADVEKRRADQMYASTWMDRLQLANVIAATLALVAGASIAFGGLF